VTFNREQFISSLFRLHSEQDFNDLALKSFHYQFEYNTVYKKFADILGTDINNINHYSKIPFLPIELYKSHRIISGDAAYERLFLSSGTTSENRSGLYVKDTALYGTCFIKAFQLFFGNPSAYHILALLPGYNEESSLVYMVAKLIQLSNSRLSGFYIGKNDKLAEVIRKSSDRKIILFGVSHALLDFSENFNMALPDLIVIETGGMKGRRKEMIREEVHDIIKKSFGVSGVYSEYGMTELFSQAYSNSDGNFHCPPWMKVLTRDVNDPLSLPAPGRTGGINIIDLANIDSCSFIATADLGKVNLDGSFEIIGRLDNSDLRGCNLMI